ncbi:MAG: S9 family peptidase [Bacteroidota bacterium]|nr:MAG: S9 family peptidase [Bacteroidota bacterium]
MKTNFLYSFMLLFMLVSCKSGKFPSIPVEYPATVKIPVTDNFFGTEVVDNYRWLEDDRSPETMQWVIKQNELTFSYLDKIPFRKDIRTQLDALINFERYSTPEEKNQTIYYFRNSGLQNHSVFYAVNKQTGEEKMIIDPNTFSADGTTSLSELSFSESGKYLAYSISEGGSDWRKIVVIDAVSLERVGDTIVDAKFTSIVWNQDEGFFYSSYDKPKGSELSAMTDMHKVYYHQLGTSQNKDKLIYGNQEQKRRYSGVVAFKNSDYLFLSAAESTSGNELYLKKGLTSENKFQPIVSNFENDFSVVYANGKDVYLYTNFKANNKRVVKLDADKLILDSITDIIPEKEEPIESVSFAGGYFFVQYLKDASSFVQQYDLKGSLIRNIDLPGIGSVTGFEGEEDQKEVFYSFESFTTPVTIYKLDVNTGKSELFRQPKLSSDVTQYETKQVFYKSKDGTRVPMFIVARKGIKLDGSNPTLLYGYGGFNISLPPYFSVRALAWLEMGGVFALANIRGGGEYGEEWHKAGMQLNKQNVFDDFIAAAEYLQQEKYTSSEKLAIMGGSNGGLLVGVVMTQRPELYRVALPAVGVLDMLRYHKFTAGAGWISDYGCADSSKAMFDYMVAYSPVHNIKDSVAYPATLVTTGDHDDRVVPAHSYKFIVGLQEKQVGELPVLIRIETKGGHGAGKSTAMALDELADQLVFAFYNMNETPVNYSEK